MKLADYLPTEYATIIACSSCGQPARLVKLIRLERVDDQIPEVRLFECMSCDRPTIVQATAPTLG